MISDIFNCCEKCKIVLSSLDEMSLRENDKNGQNADVEVTRNVFLSLRKKYYKRSLNSKTGAVRDVHTSDRFNDCSVLYLMRVIASMYILVVFPFCYNAKSLQINTLVITK